MMDIDALFSSPESKTLKDFKAGVRVIFRPQPDVPINAPVNIERFVQGNAK